MTNDWEVKEAKKQEYINILRQGNRAMEKILNIEGKEQILDRDQINKIKEYKKKILLIWRSWKKTFLS